MPRRAAPSRAFAGPRSTTTVGVGGDRALAGAETLSAEVVQARPCAARLEVIAPAAISWLPARLTFPSNPPESALLCLGHLTLVFRNVLLTVASFDLVTIFGPGALQNA